MNETGISVADVTEAVQEQMLTNIARSLNTPQHLMRIVSISDARRRLLAVSVKVQALTGDTSSANQMASKAGDLAETVVQAFGEGAAVQVEVTSAVEEPPATPNSPTTGGSGSANGGAGTGGSSTGGAGTGGSATGTDTGSAIGGSVDATTGGSATGTGSDETVQTQQQLPAIGGGVGAAVFVCLVVAVWVYRRKLLSRKNDDPRVNAPAAESQSAEEATEDSSAVIAGEEQMQDQFSQVKDWHQRRASMTATAEVGYAQSRQNRQIVQACRVTRRLVETTPEPGGEDQEAEERCV
jgi:hypothetical protein